MAQNGHSQLLWVIFTIVIVAQCQGQEYTHVDFTIPEQRPSGTEVGSIRDGARIDRKVPPRELNKLIFKFLNPNNLRETASLFNINSDMGTVYTTAMIDRENVCQFTKDCNVEFDVTVTSSVSKFFLIVNVRIVILDINDNSPRFPSDEVTLFVQESVNVNKELTIVGATDKDKDKANSVYEYEMTTEYRDVFQLKAEQKLDKTWDLKIVVLKSLDRETKNHYVLHIIAKDNGSPQRSGSVTVHINVTDDNDNAPIFTENIYNLEVHEQAKVNSVVGRVSASDADSGMNAAISYRFSQAGGNDLHDLFYIDSNSGEIKVKKPLQYDAGKMFETIVEASDRGNPPQASQTILNLMILDVGNTPPKIDINPIPNPDGNVLAIRENTAIDTVVAHVKTEDRDQGANGIVDCRSLSKNFKVTRFEGKGFLVKVARELDREIKPQRNVTIVCDDRGEPKMSVIGWFLIKLIDVNDNAPVFTQNIYKANLTENNKPGDHLLYVRANDKDAGINKQLRYSISMKSARSSFMINERTGEITVGEVFDRETLTQVTFMVKVLDRGSPRKSGDASVIVNILDQNDQSPFFTSKTTFEIAEQLPASSSVGKLEGQDSDEGMNGQVFFSMDAEKILKSGDMVPFVVFSDGHIRTDRRLIKDDQENYTVPVVITDRGTPPRSSSISITVKVISPNTNRPRFVFPSRSNRTVRVKPNAKKGTVVAMLKAVDDDTGRNAKLWYSLDRHEYRTVPFVISNNETGEILLIRDVNTLRHESFSLNVSVRDDGIPPLKARAVLVVRIDSVNGMSGSRTDGGGSARNSTSMFGKTDIKYIIIAGVVGGLTIVISIIIVVIIIFIRRPHRDPHRRGPPSGVQEQGDGRHFDKQIWQSVPVDDVSPTRDIRDKKSSSDLDLNHGDGGGGGGDFSGLKPPSNGDIPSKHSSDLLDPYNRKHTTLDTFHVQQPQLYTFKKCTLRAPSDDFQSDTSGETTTSDSGRGGSEEDIQLPPLPELREDTSRIIFKTPGSGLKDSRFVQPTYPGTAGSGAETMAFQTFSPRSTPATATTTLPSSSHRHYGGSGDRVDNVSLSSPYGTLSNPRDIHNHSLGPASSNASLNKGGGDTLLLRQKIANATAGVHQNNSNSTTALSGRSTPNHRNSQGYYSPTHPLSRPTSPPNQQQQQQQHNRYHPSRGNNTPSATNTTPKSPSPLAGPGHYPQDIPERSENPYGKKVTFQTDLTTQNLKTWDLCQKMNIQPETAAALHGNAAYAGVGGVGDIRGQRLRPRSQEEDDNTTTSGSYTINLDNDLDIDSLPPPFTTTVA